MTAKEGSFSFDFEGIYTKVEEPLAIDYTIGDGRKVKVRFIKEENKVITTESFGSENTHPHDMQRGGWQAILNNFKSQKETN